jgi:phage-related protein
MPEQYDKWFVRFYPPGDDEGPVRKAIRAVQDPQERREIALWIKQLQEFGPGHWMSVQRVKKVRSSREGLLELRIRAKQNYRILFCCQGHIIWLLHFFAKKKQDLDRQDVELADRRARQL